MENFENENGITVRQLKEIIKDWPEEKLDGGETKIWLTYDGTDHPATEIKLLNHQEDLKGNKSSDLLID